MEVLTYALTPMATNCYVVRDAGEALVIDPGEAARPLLEALEGYRVRAVVNTHGHCDHCGGNAMLLQRTGTELLGHEADLPLLRSIQQQGYLFGLQFPPSPDPTLFVNENDTVRVGGLSLEVRHTPGHSPGHIVLVGEGCVFAGDVLFQGSVGRTDLPGGDHQKLIDSIRTKLGPLPDDTVVYSGHGPATTIGAERRNNPFVAGF